MWIGLLCSVGLAQVPIVPEANLQLYRPPIDATTLMWTESAGNIVSKWSTAPRLSLHYVNRPFVIDDPETAILSDVLQANAVLSSAYDRVRVAVDLPLVLYADGDLTEAEVGIGDVSVDGRITLVDPATVGVGVAVHGRLSVASGTLDAPVGDSFPVGELGTAVEGRIGDRVVVAGNLGVRFAPEVDLIVGKVRNQGIWRVGASAQITPGVGASLDLAGRVALGSATGAGSPAEALVGGWFRTGERWVWTLGGGGGLTSAVGAGVVRVVTLLTYHPRLELDRDGDGIADVSDRCEGVAEDLDGFDDDDGCPDPSVLVEVVAVDDTGRTLPRAQIGLAEATETGGRSAQLHPGRYPVTAVAEGYAAVAGVVDVGDVAVTHRILLTRTARIVPDEILLRGERLEVGHPIVVDGALDATVVGEVAVMLAERPYLRTVVFVAVEGDRRAWEDALVAALRDHGIDRRIAVEWGASGRNP